MLEEFEIDILSMQETEIDNKLNHEELSIANYKLELGPYKSALVAAPGGYCGRTATC